MTKKEAISIERTCDQLLSDNTGFKCSCSMALNGHLKINIDKYLMLISKHDLHTLTYFSYEGFYEDFDDILTKIQRVIDENRVLFERLMWSYEHIADLE